MITSWRQDNEVARARYCAAYNADCATYMANPIGYNALFLKQVILDAQDPISAQNAKTEHLRDEVDATQCIAWKWGFPINPVKCNCLLIERKSLQNVSFFPLGPECIHLCD